MTKQELIDFEGEVAKLWEEGKINAPVHLSGGNEDELIGIFGGIRRHDYVFSGHRNHYHALLHNVPAGVLLQEILGDAEAVCKGRGRSMGFIAKDANFYSSAIVGGMCSPAVGVAWALKRKQEQDPLYGDECDSRARVWCFVGDGAIDGGHFWEALNYSQGWDLPITFVVEDNNRATKTPWEARNGRFVPEYSSKVVYYRYVPTYPHCGIGKYVQF